MKTKNMINNKIILSKKSYLLVLISIFFFLSCEKSSQEVTSGKEATVKIDLKGIIYEEEGTNMLTASKNNITGSNLGTSFHQIIPFNENYNLVATLEPITENFRKKNSVKSNGLQAAIVQRETSLPKDAKYRVIVFEKATGAYVTQQEYASGIISATDLILDAGKQYTVISYSYGTSTSIPAVSTSINLTTFTNTISGDVNFMYSKNDLNTLPGENTLAIKMKHILSQINITLTSLIKTEAGSTVMQNIGIVKAKFDSHYSNVTLNYNTLGLTHNTLIGKDAIFTESAATSKTSQITVASPSIKNGVLKFSTLTVGSNTRTDVEVKDLTVKPGVRYNLKLELLSSDDGVVIGETIWAYSNIRKVRQNGLYIFVKSREQAGSYWVPGSLDTVNINVAMPTPGSTNVVDPCHYVTQPSGTFNLWNTPNKDELIALSNTANVNGEYNGVKGRYFGTKTVPTVSNRDKYLFLPNHGYIYPNDFLPHSKNTIDGSYWSFADSRLYFNTEIINVNVETRNNRKEGHQIRCVKRKGGL